MGIPIIGDIIDAVKDVVSEAIVDVDKKKQIGLELERIKDAALARESNERIAQIELNKVEAGNSNVFVSGWRPFIGWVGGSAFLYSTLLYPFLSFICRVSGYEGMLPELDNQLLLTVMGGMLGFGALRSYDKKQGTASDSTGMPENILPPQYQEELPSTEVDRMQMVANRTEPRQIAWGAKVSPTFKDRVIWIAEELGCDPDDLMACMAWESGETFSAKVRNAAGSGAVGLIQFMPSTAIQLGTSSAKLANMTDEDQLNYVYKYFKPYKGRLRNLGDIYMAILWPKGIGQADSYVLWEKGKSPTTFRQNAGLDTNRDGRVTRAECLKKIQDKLTKGRRLLG